MTLRRARTNNPDLRVSEYSINAAEADITTATTRPNVNFNTQLLHMANRSNRQEGTGWLNSANGQYWWQVTKPFQLPGQRFNKIDYSKKLHTQSKLDYNEATRNILATVANKWLDVWAAQIDLEILQKGKGNIDTLVQINELRLRNQVITTTDLLRAQLLQHQYERDIVTAAQDYANALEQLRYMLGTTDSISIDINDNIFTSINTAGDSLIAIGTHERADVLSAKNAVDASATNIKLQRALAYPQPEAGVIWNPQNNTPYIGFYGTIENPLFNRNQGWRQKAAVIRQQAEQNLFATERQAETEVSTAYRTYVVQRHNATSFQQNLQQAEVILSNVRYAYLKGVVIGGFVIVLVMISLITKLGTEFFPPLDEGSIWMRAFLPAGSSITETQKIAPVIRRVAAHHPQIESIVTQSGRNDDGTDPYSSSRTEVMMVLRDYKTWAEDTSKTELMGRDQGGFVAEAQQKIDKTLKLPQGYTIAYGGQFENLQRAGGQLMIAIPLTVIMVLVVLFLLFKSLKYALMTLVCVLFALAGGIVALWLRDYHFNVSAGVGFVSLSGFRLWRVCCCYRLSIASVR